MHIYIYIYTAIFFMKCLIIATENEEELIEKTIVMVFQVK